MKDLSIAAAFYSIGKSGNLSSGITVKNRPIDDNEKVGPLFVPSFWYRNIKTVGAGSTAGSQQDQESQMLPCNPTYLRCSHMKTDEIFVGASGFF